MVTEITLKNFLSTAKFVNHLQGHLTINLGANAV